MPDKNNNYEIILFYNYVYLENPEEYRDFQYNLCKNLGLTGRIIVAKEGINATLEGIKENIEKYLEEFLQDSRFKKTHIKRSIGTGHAFPKLSVKVREELVSAHLGTCDVDPNEVTGIHLKAEELHEWIKTGKEFYIVDMRNAYEHKVGYFENSILPPLENFRDLPKIIKSISHLKNKTVLTVCTGGVLCEKASGYLITQGFTDVYQLDGGIVSYMEKYPNEDFVGKLYVFDTRVSMGFSTDDPKHKIVGVCESCGGQSERYVNCSTMECHRHFIFCEACEEKYGKKKCPGKCTIDYSARFGRLKKRFLIYLKNIWKTKSKKK